MRTITEEKNIYTYEELTDEAKEKALYDFTLNSWHDYDWEYQYTLIAFCNLFGVKLNNYEISPYEGYNFSVSDYYSATYPEVGGESLKEWLVEHDVYKDNTGKYVSIDKLCVDCGLTGFVSDIFILKPVMDAKNGKEKYGSYEEMLEACIESFFSDWLKNIEYLESEAYFNEVIDCNGWEFLEDGTRYA